MASSLNPGKPVCYQCNAKPTRRESKFCSDACAIDWAEYAVLQRGDEWCPDCNAWLDPVHPHAGKMRNMSDAIPPSTT